MQHSKKLLLPGIMCLLVMLLAACGGGTGTTATPTAAAPAAAPASQQIFRYPTELASDFSTMDPALSQDTGSDFAIKPVFVGLEELNNKGDVEDQLATSHQVSADGLSYTFNINPSAKFSDGTPVTADDVAFSIDRTMQPATNSQVASYMNLLKDYDKLTTGKIKTVIGDSVIVVDPHTIKLVISKKAAYFLTTMTYDCWYTVEKSLVLKYGSTKWTDHLSEGGGSGPYKVEAWNHNKGLDLVPNPNWYGKAPKLQRIEYHQSGTADTTYKSYQNGQYDYSTVPAPEVPTAKTGVDFHEFPGLATTYITMNYLAKPFDNIKIRQAFALAINRDVLNSTILNNSVTPTWSFIPDGIPGSSAIKGPDNVTATSGDKAKAQQLLKEGLAEAGYASAAALPAIKMTYYAPSTAVTNYITAIINMWNTTLGVKVTTQLLDFPKLIDSISASSNNPNGLQMWRAGWQADYTDPQDWLSIFFNPKGDDNNMNYGQNKTTAASAQQTVQQSLQAADVDTDVAHRIKAYTDAEQKIINDVAVIPLWHPKNQVVVKTYVYGLVLNGLAIIPPEDWANIYIAQH